MPACALEIDYLVIGAGATALVFVDTLLSEDADATVLMVQHRHVRAGVGFAGAGTIPKFELEPTCRRLTTRLA